jgi:hypothetical protein
MSVELGQTLPELKQIVADVDSTSLDVFRKAGNNSDIEVGIEIIHQFIQGKGLLVLHLFLYVLKYHKRSSWSRFCLS